MGHDYGPGHMFDTPTAHVRAEAQLVEHHLTVNVTNNGRTISTSRLPLTAGAPIAAAGITAP
jgi:hypothetical protein